MADIKFSNPYSYDQEASPFWLVWCEARAMPAFKHPTKESAETEAARLASFNPGVQFHVLGVLATIQTSPDIIGTRFDPSKTPPAPPKVEEPAPFPEFDKFVAAPVPAIAPVIAAAPALEEHDDDLPF